MQSLKLEIKESSYEAPNYKENGEGFVTVKLTKAIVVRKGMLNGNDTIDLQFEDDAGNKYVALITAKLLKTVTDIAITEYE